MLTTRGDGTRREYTHSGIPFSCSTWYHALNFGFGVEAIISAVLQICMNYAKTRISLAPYGCWNQLTSLLAQILTLTSALSLSLFLSLSSNWCLNTNKFSSRHLNSACVHRFLAVVVFFIAAAAAVAVSLSLVMHVNNSSVNNNNNDKKSFDPMFGSVTMMAKLPWNIVIYISHIQCELIAIRLNRV